jgi:hypothetical protein
LVHEKIIDIELTQLFLSCGHLFSQIVW